MMEGPAQFYTGFAFDLEQDLLQMANRTISKGSSKLHSPAVSGQTTPRQARKNLEQVKLNLEAKTSNVVDSSRYKSVVEDLKRKYLEPAKSARLSLDAPTEPTTAENTQRTIPNLKLSGAMT